MARYKSGPHTTAQTDTVVVSVPSGQGFRVTHWYLEVGAPVSVAYVSAVLEFDDTADVPFASHSGVRPGSGVSENGPNGEGIAEGADGQDVLLTCSVPTGGSCTLWLNGEFFPTA